MVGLTSYWLASLMFHVNQPSHYWSYRFFLNFKVPGEVKVQSHKMGRLPIDSHPFHSMSTGHPTPGIQLYQNLTLKIQGQGHIMGSTSYWLTSLMFHVSIAVSMYLYQRQSRFRILSINPPIPEIQLFFFKFDLENPEVKVMGEARVQSHKVGPTPFWLSFLSCHVNQTCHSRETAFSKSDLENSRPRS